MGLGSHYARLGSHTDRQLKWDHFVRPSSKANVLIELGVGTGSPLALMREVDQRRLPLLSI